VAWKKGRRDIQGGEVSCQRGRKKGDGNNVSRKSNAQSKSVGGRLRQLKRKSAV